MKFPKTKPMLMPYINESKNGITIGGFQYRIGRDLITETPDAMLELLRSLDGKTTVEEVATKFEIDKIDLIEILNDLKELGVIYENIHISNLFSDEELEFYLRNLNFFAWIDKEGIYYNYWDVQSKLKNSHVLVLGCGGTGSVCLNSLARMGIGNLTFIDCDYVEISNLNRQEFNYSDLDLKKVDATFNRLKNINPFINLRKIHKKITTYEDLLDFDEKFDLIICCIDKPDDITDTMFEYTKMTKTPHILGGYASTIFTAGLFTNESNKFSDLMEQYKKINFDVVMVNTLTEWKWDNAIIAPVANISGNFSALFALYYLTNLSDLEPGKLLHVDLFNMYTEHATYVL